VKALPKPLVLFLKGAVTVLAIWLVLRHIDDVPAILDAVRSAHWGWLFLCLGAHYASCVLNAMRWKVLVPLVDTPLHKYLYYVFVGHFLNFFLPSTALAEGARTYAFGRKYGGMQKNFAAALFARGSGLAVQSVIIMLFLAWSWDEIRALEAWETLRLNPAPVIVVAAVSGAGLAVALFFWADKVRFFVGILIGFVRDIRLFAQVLFLSALIQACVMAGVYALFRSITPDIQFWHVAVIPIVVHIILMIPVSFGGVGVREYLNILFYTGLAGIAAEVTLTVSLLAYVYWGIMAGTGAAWMALRKRATLASQNLTDGKT
jgi:glycosyltransferase 2 family protein